MKVLVFAMVAVMTLAGCSSSSSVSPKTYLLPQANSNDVAMKDMAMRKDQPILLVQPVNVAAYLEGEGLAYLVSDTEVVIAQNHLWGKSLSEQISEAVVQTLRRPSARFWAMSPNASLNSGSLPRLQINIDRFDGNYQGNATVAGEWVLVNGNGDAVMSRTFSYQEPLADEGYQALVNALAKALSHATQSMGLALENVAI